jgi:hypothetical protein
VGEVATPDEVKQQVVGLDEPTRRAGVVDRREYRVAAFVESNAYTGKRYRIVQGYIDSIPVAQIT